MKLGFLEKNHTDSSLISRDSGVLYHKTRWVFEISNDKKWRCHFYLGREYSTNETEWRPRGQYYSFFFRNEFEVKRDDMYYDGWHKFLSLGFLKFAWSN